MVIKNINNGDILRINDKFFQIDVRNMSRRVDGKEEVTEYSQVFLTKLSDYKISKLISQKETNE